MPLDERDRQDDLEGDVDEPRERRRDEEEQERAVADDDAERVAGRRLLGRVVAVPGQVAQREHEAGEEQRGRPGEERRPAAEEEEQRAGRRPERDPEVGRHPHGRVRLLVPVGRHEVGDHRLARRASDLEDEPAETHQREADELAPADGEEAEHQRHLARPRDEDQRPAADVVREVAAGVAGEDADHRADQERDADGRLARVQMPDRPEPDEAPHRRAAHRAREVDREDRAERPVDVGAPDQPEEAGEEAHATLG